jgi:plastocyanin
MKKPLFEIAAAAAALAVTAAPAGAAALTVTVLDANGAPLAEAVVAVYLKGVRSRADAGKEAQMGQKDRQFTPQVLAIQTGTAVLFPNFDTVRHHVYSFSPAQRFELKLYAGTPAAPVVFDKPGTATLGCNIHDRMAGWVRVVDTPLFAKTNAAGQATLEVPAGEHQVEAWAAPLGETAAVPVQPLTMGSGPSQLAIRLGVKVPA